MGYYEMIHMFSMTHPFAEERFWRILAGKKNRKKRNKKWEWKSRRYEWIACTCSLGVRRAFHV